jgi:hypothetical protein
MIVNSSEEETNMISAWKPRKCLIRLLAAASLAVFAACQSSLRPAQACDATNGPVMSNPAAPSDDYWTPERMKNAKPMPMPTVPDPSLRKGQPGSPEQPAEAPPGEPGAAPGKPPETTPDHHR